MTNVIQLRLTAEQILKNAADELEPGDHMVVVVIKNEGGKLRSSVWGTNVDPIHALIAQHRMLNLTDYLLERSDD
jgi:hypothetical protein